MYREFGRLVGWGGVEYAKSLFTMGLNIIKRGHLQAAVGNPEWLRMGSKWLSSPSPDKQIGHLTYSTPLRHLLGCTGGQRGPIRSIGWSGQVLAPNMIALSVLFKLFSCQTSTQTDFILKLQEGNDGGSNALIQYFLKPFIQMINIDRIIRVKQQYLRQINGMPTND